MISVNLPRFFEIPFFKKWLGAMRTVPSWTSVCYRQAFYPGFLQFTILQARRTSPSQQRDVGHSWRNYRSLNAHPLRSTVFSDDLNYLGVSR